MITLECIGPGFTYRWPGGEVHLMPGKPIDLPDERAKRLLMKAPGRVRMVHSFVQGATVAWLRSDGTRHIGLIDFVHSDEQGNPWVFVTTGKAWSALSMKCVEWSPL